MSEGPVASVNPRGFKVAEGYVEVKADVDETDVRRAAHRVTNTVEHEGRRRRFSFFRALFTPDQQILSALRTGIPNVLGTPITASALALAAIFAASFVGALASAFLTAGIATVFLGLGAFIVSENSKLAKKLLQGIADDAKKIFKRITEPLVFPILIALARIRLALREELQEPLALIFESLADTIAPLTTGVLDFVKIIADSLAENMPAFAEILAEIGRNLPGLADSIADFFKTFAENKEEIKAMVDALFAFTGWAIRIAAPIIISLGGMLVELREDFQKLRRGVAIVTGAVRLAWHGLWRSMQDVADNIVGTITKVRDWWGKLPGWARNAVSRAVLFFMSLPIRIAAAVSGIPAAMYNAGVKMISSLVSGIRDSLPSVSSIMDMVGHVIGNFVPGSPIKEGPLMVFNSPSTNPGTKLADMFIGGFADRMRQWQGEGLAMATPNVTVNPTTSAPPMDVHVYLDGREITGRVETVIRENNRQLRRAVRSGGKRIP